MRHATAARLAAATAMLLATCVAAEFAFGWRPRSAEFGGSRARAAIRMLGQGAGIWLP